MAIKFQSHRPRGYWLMPDATPAKMVDNDAWGKRLTSVTTALGVLDKPALKWWSMERGIEGVLELIARGEITVDRGAGDIYDLWIKDAEIRVDPDLEGDVKRIARCLTKAKLTVNHIVGKAAKRGTGAHDAFEAWCETGILPDPRGWPLEERGYISALRALIDTGRLEPEHTEVMIGSVKYQFGGRYDYRGGLDGKKSLVDIKTSKGIYTTHYLQLEAYEGASLECGWEPTEQRAVIRLGADGTYEVKTSAEASRDGIPCDYEDFLAILRTQRVCDRLGGL